MTTLASKASFLVRAAVAARSMPWLVVRLVAVVVFLVVGYFAVRDLVGFPALQWMAQYRFEDFRGFQDLALFLRELRTGVPPLLASLEVSCHLLFGDASFMLEDVYRLAFVLAFLLPPLFFSRSKIEFALSYAISMFFMLAAAKIVPLNPQTYDIYFSLLALLFIVAARGCIHAKTAAARRFLALLAGLSLGAFELCRPFALLLVPVLLLHGYRVIRPHSPRLFVLLLIPFLLISGGWHLKLAILQDGQVLISNYGGRNLFQTWKPLLKEVSDPKLEPPVIRRGSPQYRQLTEKRFQGTGRLARLKLDTAWFSRSSAEQMRVVRRFALGHPLLAVKYTFVEMLDTLGGHTVFFLRHGAGVSPFGPSPIRHPDLYALVVRATALYAFLNGLWLIVRWVRERSLSFLAEPATAVIGVLFVALGITSIAESGEEARSLVSLLPLLACLPRTFELPKRTDPGPGQRPQRPFSRSQLP